MNEWETIEQALRASRCAFLVRQLREETRLALNAQCAEALEDWAALRDRYEGECEWKANDGGTWSASCTPAHVLSLRPALIRHCPHCGKPIVEREES